MKNKGETVKNNTDKWKMLKQDEKQWKNMENDKIKHSPPNINQIWSKNETILPLFQRFSPSLIYKDMNEI